MPTVVQGAARYANARHSRQRARGRSLARGNRVTQAFRLPTGGIIDRSRPLRFEFDGTAYEGYAGDTLASALLANGVHLVARSFKYHRPRGILCSGSDEPNALLQLDRGARTEPNVRATTQELFDGLVAASQNRWPSLRFDVGAINNALSRLLPAGFYYKTFMWPPTPRWWLRYEHFIRRAAGIGRSARASIRALRRAGDRRRTGRARCGTRSGARRCARHRLRREPGLRRRLARHE
ncbi:MAG: hypothetical protein E6H69_04385 [Betaproteobacteria bacterium]|nr:MAG: hypothetical protein E6H69_04385 [Betaproteobacteria bacterium]